MQIPWLLYSAQYDKGMEELKVVIDTDPNWPNGYAYLGFFLRDFNEAIKLIEKALRMNPLSPPWYFLFLGRAYRGIGMYEEAIAVYKSSPQRAPDEMTF